MATSEAFPAIPQLAPDSEEKKKERGGAAWLASGRATESSSFIEASAASAGAGADSAVLGVLRALAAKGLLAVAGAAVLAGLAVRFQPPPSRKAIPVPPAGREAVTSPLISERPGSSLELVSGANAGAGLFSEAVPSPERPTSAAAASTPSAAEAPEPPARIEPSTPAVAPSAEAQARASGTVPADPFGGRRLGSRFGSLSAEFAKGQSFQWAPLKTPGSPGREPAMFPRPRSGAFADRGPMSSPFVRKIQSSGRSGRALWRAAFLSARARSRAEESRHEEASYEAQEAFEPGKADGSLDGNAGDADSDELREDARAPLIGSGASGAGGMSGRSPTFEPPEPKTTENGWSKLALAAMLLTFSVIVGLMVVSAFVKGLLTAPFAFALAAALCAAALAIGVLGALLAAQGQAILGGFYIAVGALLIGMGIAMALTGADIASGAASATINANATIVVATLLGLGQGVAGGLGGK